MSRKRPTPAADDSVLGGAVPGNASRYGAALADVVDGARHWPQWFTLGNLDFMDETSAMLVPFRMIAVADCKGVYDEREQWADPDVAAAAAYLRALAEEPARYVGMRHLARAMVEERLGLDGFGKAVVGPLGPPRRRTGADIRALLPVHIADFARGGIA